MTENKTCETQGHAWPDKHRGKCQVCGIDDRMSDDILTRYQAMTRHTFSTDTKHGRAMADLNSMTMEMADEIKHLKEATQEQFDILHCVLDGGSVHCLPKDARDQWHRGEMTMTELFDQGYHVKPTPTPRWSLFAVWCFTLQSASFVHLIILGVVAEIAFDATAGNALFAAIIPPIVVAWLVFAGVAVKRKLKR